MNPHVEFDIAVEKASDARKKDLMAAKEKCDRLYDLARGIVEKATADWTEEAEQVEDLYDQAITEARMKFRARLED